MKKLFIALVFSVLLCGCNAAKQGASAPPVPVPPGPGSLGTSGGWEFVLTTTGSLSSQQGYVEANLTSPQAGTYSDAQLGGSQVFVFDSSTSAFDYLGTGTNVVSLTVNANNQVNGTFNSQIIGGSAVNFTGTAANGTSISGTWSGGNTSEYGTLIGYMTTTATSVNGTYSSLGITETVEGDTITEASQFGSGSYPLAGNVGNFAFVNGGGAFWDGSEACSLYTCAIWLDKITGDLVVVGYLSEGSSQVLGILPNNNANAPVSAWAGTYTGDLNFAGCPSQNPCGGDSLTLTVAQAYDNPEFSPTLTITGTDSTTGQAFTGTGDTLYISLAPSGPGTAGGDATFTTNLSNNSFSVVASGSSQDSSPVVMQTLLVYNCTGPVNSQTATCGGNGAYLGTLTRQ